MAIGPVQPIMLGFRHPDFHAEIARRATVPECSRALARRRAIAAARGTETETFQP
jgi:hypothetical protein